MEAGEFSSGVDRGGGRRGSGCRGGVGEVGLALRVFGGGALFGEVYGRGAARALALHGWGRDRHDFDRVLDGMDAVSLDLPGFGASPPPARAMGAAGYAQAVERVLDDFAVPPVVVGHSFGGRVATALAAARPDRVAGLVLTGAPLLAPSPRDGPRPRISPAYRLVRWAHRLGLVSGERLEAERRRRGSADYRAARGVMREVLVTAVNESYEEELSGLSCPVRLVWGADDREVPVSTARRIADLCGARLEIVEGAGHNLPRSAPDRLRRVVEEALADVGLIGSGDG